MKKVNSEGEMYNEVGIQYKGLESPHGARQAGCFFKSSGHRWLL